MTGACWLTSCVAAVQEAMPTPLTGMDFSGGTSRYSPLQYRKVSCL